LAYWAIPIGFNDRRCMMLSDKALQKLLESAENPVIVFLNRPLADAAIIEELEVFGLVQPETPDGKWYEVSPAGYDFAEQSGANVWRFSTSKVAA
jgi:hypothetical protein